MLATVCGYGFAEIDAMTMDQFEALCDYWRDHPPLHLLAGAYFGIGKPSPRPAPANDLIRLLGADPEKGGAMRL